jgi:hypothetical protein
MFGNDNPMPAPPPLPPPLPATPQFASGAGRPTFQRPSLRRHPSHQPDGPCSFASPEPRARRW